MTIQATVLLALAALVTLLLRRLSASFRHYVWVSCLLALPFLAVPSLLMPTRPVALAPTARSLPSPAAPMALSAPTAAKDTAPAPLTAPNPGTASARPGIPSPTSLLPAFFPDWRLALCVLWMAGVLISLGRLAAGLVGTRALTRASVPIEDGPVSETAVLLRLDTTPVIFRQALSPETAPVPMTWGVVRPVVLFPADADTWPHDRLRAVLLHETAHVRRGDWLTQTLIQIVCAALWFHPFVWLAARACRAESERACDDFVLTTGMAAPDYARHLLDVALAANGRRLTGTVAMAQTTRIEMRLKNILAVNRDRRPLTRRLWLGAFAVSLVMIGTAGVLAQAAGLDGQTVQTVPPSSPDTATETDASQSTTMPEFFRLSLVLIQQSPSSPGTKECTFDSTFSYDPYKQPSVPWTGKPNPIADFRQTFYSEPLDAAKGLYFCTPAFIGSFDQVSAKPPLLQLDSALMENPEGPYIMGVHVRPYATGVHLITLLQTFPVSRASVPFKFGIADGPFQTVTCPKTSGKTEISNPAGPTTFTLNPAPDARGRTELQISDPFPSDNQRIILAFDGDGRAVYDIKEDLGSSDNKLPTNLICHFPASILPRVAQFQLLYRPYVWASRTLTVEPNPAKMPDTAQIANTHASFPEGPVEKVVAERESYDTKNKIAIFQHATITLAYKGRILGIARCRHAKHNPDGGWTLWDATVAPSQGTTFHTDIYIVKANGRTIVGYP